MPIPDLTQRPRAKFALRVLLGGYVAFSALNAQAAEHSVAAAFGNTVVSTYADGRSQKVWLHEDGSWEGISRRGHNIAGRWSLKGDQVCLRQSRPMPLPISYCTNIPDGAEPGFQWASKDVSGTPIKLSLVKGIVKPAGR